MLSENQNKMNLNQYHYPLITYLTLSINFRNECGDSIITKTYIDRDR